MDDFKLLIAGDRDFANYSLLSYYTEATILSQCRSREILIVSDAVEGAGILGERFAAENGIEVAEFIPQNLNDDTLTKVFNDMAVYADTCLYFWDGLDNNISKKIAVAKKENLQMFIVTY